MNYYHYVFSDKIWGPTRVTSSLIVLYNLYWLNTSISNNIADQSWIFFRVKCCDFIYYTLQHIAFVYIHDGINMFFSDLFIKFQILLQEYLIKKSCTIFQNIRTNSLRKCWKFFFDIFPRSINLVLAKWCIHVVDKKRLTPIIFF